MVAGQLLGMYEPGLVLTLPETASEEDDGYPSASEIAALKHDADWVVLSASNTAADSTSSAEALSGLGRALIYAGARALLVSHWEVRLGSHRDAHHRCCREMVGDPGVGRAEALRRAMLALIGHGKAAQPCRLEKALGEGAPARDN